MNRAFVGFVAYEIIGEVFRSGSVEVIQREGHRQPSGRIDLAGQHIGNRIAGFLSRQPCAEYRIRQIAPGCGFDGAADIKHYDYLLSCSLIDLADILQQVLFILLDQEVGGEYPVPGLSGGTSEGDDSIVAALSRFFNQGAGYFKFGLLCVSDVDVDLVVGNQVFGDVGRVVLVKLLQPCIHVDSSRLQALVQLTDIRAVYESGAVSARNHIIGIDTEQGCVALGYGQGTVVLEKHHSIRCKFAGDSGVCFQIRLEGTLGAFESGSLDYEFQQGGDAAVQVFHFQAAILQTLEYMLGLHRVAAHQKVGTCVQLLGSVALAGPVRHYQALESKVLAQDFGEKVVTFLGIFSVQVVVGGHYGPGLCIPHAEFECLDIEFPKCPGVHAGIPVQTVGFLVVCSEVLGGCADALVLHALHVCGGNQTGEHRILREILEVPAVQGVTQQVHARAKDYVVAHRKRFVRYYLADCVCCFPVPRCCGEQPSGKAGSGVFVQPDAHRPVHQNNRRNPEAGDSICYSAGAGQEYFFIRGNIPLAHAYYEGRLFFGGHRLYYLGDVVFGKFRLR